MKSMRVCTPWSMIRKNAETNNWEALDDDITTQLFLMISQHYRWKFNVTENKLCPELLARNEYDIFFPAGRELKNISKQGELIPVVYDDIPFFVRAPDLLSAIYAPIKPFTLQLWLLVVATWLIGTVVFYSINKFASHFINGGTTDFRLYKLCLEMFFSFCGKDVSYFNNATGGLAVFAAVWSMSAFVLSYAYSGGLMSHLTFPGLRFVPKNYRQLIDAIENNRFQAGIIDLYFIMIYVEESKYGTGKEVKRMMDNGGVLKVTMSEALQKLYNEDFAFIFFGMHGKTYFGNRHRSNAVNVLVSEDSVSSSVYGFLARTGFPLSDKFHKAVLRSFETGFVNRLIQKKTEKWRVEKKSTEFTPLGLEELSGPILMLLIGYASSILIILLEIIFSTYQTKRRKPPLKCF